MSSTPLSLRRAEVGDIPALYALRLATMEGYLINGGIDADEQTHLSRIIDHWNDAHIILMEGKLAGLFKYYLTDDAWFIGQIQVAPEFQRRGIGQQLLAGVLQQAQREGLAVELKVLKSNPAKNLYLRLGFIITTGDDYAWHMRREPPITAD
ncbi:Putatative acetyltransferase protein [Sodalis praecaptivus]|uniref:Putatative acetyltransferase protein n=1 Tax=Sodalis praecaptivus TaxID=1239307 RepID=W0HQY8_9GAMM|nr:GNAT family N-acetyltransferase [Sodalis praecaptivus]AHF76214.1 Putatative acetyltransferase protein [Sodalis praecaptivus]